MFRLLASAIAGAALLVAATAQAAPAPAAAPRAAAQAGPARSAAPGDLFTVTGIRVDATGESSNTARDAAMAQGRPQAFQKLFRRLTASSVWSRQPQLADAQLFRLIRSFEVTGERRSTTRYLADVTYHFNPVAVRQFLRQAGVAFTETRSRPALVIPILGDSGFDLGSGWTMVWTDPSHRQGLVPMVLPEGDATDMELLSRPDVAQVDWQGFQPLVRRYNAGEIVLAIAGADGRSVRAIEISATGRTATSFAFAQPNFAGLADSVTEKVAETWKSRSSVDYATRSRLVADVQFNSLEDWAKIRTQLGTVRSVSDFEVLGLARNEAEIDLSYFGRIEQLRDALAQQNLDLSNTPAGYTLQLGGATAVNTP